jgi:hypothetical protein
VLLARLSVNKTAFGETSNLRRSGGPICMAQGHGRGGMLLTPSNGLAHNTQQRTACLCNSPFLLCPVSAPKKRANAGHHGAGLTKGRLRPNVCLSVSLQRKVSFEFSELDFVSLAVGVNRSELRDDAVNS